MRSVSTGGFEGRSGSGRARVRVLGITGRALLLAVAGLLLTASLAFAGNMDVVVWGQGDPRWASVPLGQGGYTLGQAGCAVTAASMVANYYGSAKDPGQICQALNSGGGFQPGTGYLYWAKIPAAAGGTISYAGWVNYPGIPADMNKINAELDAGYPVIAEVRLNGQMHFVVITGHDGATYYINDSGYKPSTGDKTTFNARYGSPVADYIYSIQLYHGTHSAPPPAVFKTYVKPVYSTQENVVFSWDNWPGAVKYGASVWKYPYGADQYLVFDQYVTGTSRDIGKLPAGQYRLKMLPYYGSGVGPLSAPADFKVVAPPAISSAGFTNSIAYELKSFLNARFVIKTDKPDVTAKLVIKTSAGDKTIFNGPIANAANTYYRVLAWDGKVAGKRLPSAAYTWALTLTKDGVSTTRTGKITVSKIVLTMSGTSASGVAKKHTGYMVPGNANVYVTAKTSAAPDTFTVKLTGPNGFAPASRYWALSSAPLNTAAYFSGTSAIKTAGVHTFTVTGKKNVAYTLRVIQ